MRSRRSFVAAIWVVAALWAGAFAPSHAQTPEPPASPTPGAMFSPSAAAPAIPQATSSPGAESNPFPSPSPQALPPARNGYVAAGYVAGNASGGQIAPLPNSTSTPTAFPASNQSGFWIDALGRLGPSYLAQLLYDNLSVHGADHPLLSYGQLRLEYEPRASHAAFGLAMLAVQRSTSNANMTGFGIGASLLPEFGNVVTPYASLYVYPHIQTGGVGATFTSLDLGALFVPQRRGGLFFRLGGALRSGLPSTTSPNTTTGLQLGLGTSF